MHPLIINTIEQFLHSGVDDVRLSGLLLAEAAWGMTTEQIAFATLIFTTMAGGVGFFTKWAFSQVDALRTMANERIAAAEKREAEEKVARKEDRDTHNKRMDSAIEGISMLTRTVQEQTVTIKAAQDGHREELRRVSDGVAQIRTQLRIDRDPA
jgi:hypothetical protein